jgi:hypothetical protein
MKRNSYFSSIGYRDRKKITILPKVLILQCHIDLLEQQGTPRGSEPLEAEAGSDQPLYSSVILFHNVSVILFHNVVEILDLAQPGEAPEPLVLFQFDDRLGIGGVLIDRDGARINCVRPGEGFFEELLGSSGVAPGAEPEVNGLTAAVGTDRPSGP